MFHTDGYETQTLAQGLASLKHASLVIYHDLIGLYNARSNVMSHQNRLDNGCVIQGFSLFNPLIDLCGRMLLTGLGQRCLYHLSCGVIGGGMIEDEAEPLNSLRPILM